MSSAEITQQVEDLKYFLASAPANWEDPKENIKRYNLPTGETNSCVLWNNIFHITGTDIVKCLVFRFLAINRPVQNIKKFEEGVFSDLRNLKANQDATLEEPRSEFLEFLYKNACIRTQKKQKVFYWYSVPHDRLFVDALERDLKREAMGQEPTTSNQGMQSVPCIKDQREEILKTSGKYQPSPPTEPKPAYNNYETNYQPAVPEFATHYEPQWVPQPIPNEWQQTPLPLQIQQGYFVQQNETMPTPISSGEMPPTHTFLQNDKLASFLGVNETERQNQKLYTIDFNLSLDSLQKNNQITPSPSEMSNMLPPLVAKSDSPPLMTPPILPPIKLEGSSNYKKRRKSTSARQNSGAPYPEPNTRRKTQPALASFAQLLEETVPIEEYVPEFSYGQQQHHFSNPYLAIDM